MRLNSRGGNFRVGSSSRLHRGLAGLGALLLTWLAVAPTSHPVLADGSGPTFQNSALTGGGFISVLAQASDATLVAGGDTQGFFRSVDGGQTWTPQDAGLPASGYHVAALLTVGTTWFAAVGDGGVGGVAESLDDGVTWVESASGKGAAPPLFDGTNLPGETGHPRATGALLASDGTFLYAASFGRGLQRWALSSPSLAAGWQCVALCTSFLNSLTLDGKGDAFISVISRNGASKGVYEVTGLGSKVNTKALSAKKGVSTGVQELLSLGSRVYAAGANGIGYWSGGTWSVLDPAQHWYTLTGYETVAGAAPVDILYAATYAGIGANDVEQLSVSGTHVVITGLVPDGSVGATIYGTTNQWWEATDAGGAGKNLGPASMIGGCPSSSSTLCAGSSDDDFAGSNILLETHNGGVPDTLFVSGRSGIWFYNPATTPAWVPAVAGLDTTFDLAVAVDPADSSNVAATDADWNVLASTDDMNDVDDAVQPPLFTNQSSTGLGVTWDASVSPSALIISGGNRSANKLGSIWYDATWAAGGPWTSLRLPTGVSSRPIALAARAIGSDEYILLAAFQKTGVYAFTGSGTSGTWALVSAGGPGGPTISPADIHGVSLAWASDGSAVFMYDTGTHAVWESAVTGVSFAPWVKLYADASTSPGRGWVAADPNTPTVVWIANTNGLGFIDTAACTSACVPTWVTSSAGGPLATYSSVNGDYVYMASGGAAPSFWEVQVTDCAVSCPVATGFTDPYFDEVAGSPVSLAAGTDGSVYLATLGNGIAVGTAP
jgi:hypothetical protein